MFRRRTKVLLVWNDMRVNKKMNCPFKTLISWFRCLIRISKTLQEVALLDWTPDTYHAADTDLLLWGMRKHPGNEDAVWDELQPSIAKTRCFSWSQDVEGVAEKRMSFNTHSKTDQHSKGAVTLATFLWNFPKKGPLFVNSVVMYEAELTQKSLSNQAVFYW